MKDILLVGAGGHAKSCIDAIEAANHFRILGLIGLQDEVGSHVCGYPVLGTDHDLKAFSVKTSKAFITVGQIKTPEPRIRIAELISQHQFSVPAIQSPHAVVSTHAKISQGTIVLHFACVNAGAEIGQHTIINTKSLIEHDVSIGDFTHIATGAIINGGCRIGNRVFIGSGTVVRENVSIGDDVFVPMGSRVLRDIPAGTFLQGAHP